MFCRGFSISILPVFGCSLESSRFTLFWPKRQIIPPRENLLIKYFEDLKRIKTTQVSQNFVFDAGLIVEYVNRSFSCFSGHNDELIPSIDYRVVNGQLFLKLGRWLELKKKIPYALTVCTQFETTYVYSDLSDTNHQSKSTLKYYYLLKKSCRDENLIQTLHECPFSLLPPPSPVSLSLFSCALRSLS